MPLKTITSDKLEEPFHLAMVVNVLGENVFAQWTCGEPCEAKKAIPGPVRTRQFTEGTPTGCDCCLDQREPRAAPVSKNGTFPAPLFRTVRIKYRAPWSWFPKQRTTLAGLHHAIDALREVGTIRLDDITQAENLGDPLPLNVVEHDFQRLEISSEYQWIKAPRAIGGNLQPEAVRQSMSAPDLVANILSTTLEASFTLILAPSNRIRRSGPTGQVHDVMVSKPP